MHLAMTRPWKHPSTGIYWFRRRVPDSLRPILGKLEEKRSLGTRDPAEAKKRHAQVLLEVEERWANARQGPRDLDWNEAQLLAGEVYRWQLQRFADDPFRQREWDLRIGAALFDEIASHDKHLDLGAVDVDLASRLRMRGWCDEAADRLLAERGMTVTAAGRERLTRAVALAMQQASSELKAAEAGAFAKTRTTSFATNPVAVVSPTSPAQARSVSLEDLLKGWAKEKRPIDKTLYMWGRVVKQLEAFLGHGDGGAITADDLVRWKLHLIEKELAHKTIRDSKLAPIRAILQWGVDNRHLTANPADRITIGIKAVAGESKRIFSDAEARTILNAAMARKETHLKWVPWLCAYSGARISEVCQLQRHDIHKHDGIWVMKFAAESGHLKNTNSERAVPLHSALISAGFLAFVETIKAGPLFVDLAPDRFGRRGGNGTKVLSRFVRDLGITDKRIAPNHSWRHRMSTVRRRYGMAEDITHAIMGHGRRTVADTYGEFPVEAMLRELEKIPALKLTDETS